MPMEERSPRRRNKRRSEAKRNMDVDPRSGPFCMFMNKARICGEDTTKIEMSARMEILCKYYAWLKGPEYLRAFYKEIHMRQFEDEKIIDEDFKVKEIRKKKDMARWGVNKSPYLLWLNSYLVGIGDTLAGKDTMELAIEAGQRWEMLSENEKERWRVSSEKSTKEGGYRMKSGNIKNWYLETYK
ncbi:hypothetical protein ENBRE01_2701 [Enteropsectra breve]|nr:hypothetical protein ENBRE01_2701 [Enteropsectra breve]